MKSTSQNCTEYSVIVEDQHVRHLADTNDKYPQ